jgi:transposase InsO family protein
MIGPSAHPGAAEEHGASALIDPNIRRLDHWILAADLGFNPGAEFRRRVADRLHQLRGEFFPDRPCLDSLDHFLSLLKNELSFTPVQSPESNGIAEAFVKTFKRDYARVHPLPDAATVLRQIAGWFDDYNESHAHSGLGMFSPREFIRAQAR